MECNSTGSDPLFAAFYERALAQKSGRMSHIANGISSWLQEPRLTSCPRQLHAGLALIFAEKMSRMVRYYFIIGLPGFVTIEDDAVQTTALQIATVYVVRNPEKLPAPQ